MRTGSHFEPGGFSVYSCKCKHVGQIWHSTSWLWFPGSRVFVSVLLRNRTARAAQMLCSCPGVHEPSASRPLSRVNPQHASERLTNYEVQIGITMPLILTPTAELSVWEAFVQRFQMAYNVLHHLRHPLWQPENTQTSCRSAQCHGQHQNASMRRSCQQAYGGQTS